MSASSFAQTARVQVIHNSADPAATRVDVYLNGGLLIDDFSFRSATPFIDAPAETPITISIAPYTSTSSAEAIANFEYTLTEGEKYVIIANGVLDPSSFGANPDAVSTGFNLFVKSGARETASSSTSNDIIFFHGSTDAPTVDVLGRDVATLVDNASYTQFTDYLSIAPGKYLLDVTPGDDNSVIVATARAFLQNVSGIAATVFASGFFSTDDEPAGARKFKVMYALSDGSVKTFPISASAPVQIIHNAADPAATEVDIYLNGDLAIDNFAFRTATPYISLPANQEITIGFAPGTSTSSADILATFPLTLRADEGYVVIANGVLDPTAFAANPDDLSIGFNLWVKTAALAKSDNTDNIIFFGVHGSTDAPEVDIIARDVATLLDDVKYGAISNYIEVPAASYILDVTLPDDPSAIVASYDADLSTLGGGSAVVFASGFLDPTANPTGSLPFGLYYTLADGTTGAFPAYEERISIGSTSVEVFPNPVSDKLNINFNADFSGNVSISNLAGQIIETFPIISEGANQFQVNVTDYKKGLYLIHVSGGGSSESFKISIQ
jgi:hypothetical protein